MNDFSELEVQRQKIQSELDGLKTQKERNMMGQFSTPIALANDILSHARKIMPQDEKVSFLDPAIGTGVFFSALHTAFPENRIEVATGFEIDKHYEKPSKNLWLNTNLNYELKDFTRQMPKNEDEKFNLIICNPPYVRHHHINEEKKRLQAEALSSANMQLSGLSGLYCYFIALAHRWMKKNGIAGWLVPSGFMDINYGQSVKNYLLNEVTLIQIHRFDPSDVQFNDALVSSAILWIKNKKPTKQHKVKFTFGGTIEHPTHERHVSSEVLITEKKWTRFPLLKEREANNVSRLSDFFIIKRGIATGDNKFFVLTKNEIETRNLPVEQFRPILPSPRYLNVTEIKADQSGFPKIDNQLFVLDCKLPMNEIQSLYPELHSYLKEGIERGVSNRYLCKHRKIWYSQENRSESSFYCTYIGRSRKNGKRPFRFILNHSKAIVANSYLILYPKLHLEKAILNNSKVKERLLELLNQITGRTMLEEARAYGGGMYKMEPKELANVPAIEIQKYFEMEANLHHRNQQCPAIHSIPSYTPL